MKKHGVTVSLLLIIALQTVVAWRLWSKYTELQGRLVNFQWYVQDTINKAVTEQHLMLLEEVSLRTMRLEIDSLRWEVVDNNALVSSIYDMIYPYRETIDGMHTDSVVIEKVNLRKLQKDIIRRCP